MDPILQALVMGTVQGLTEFLPISSSGHLVLVPRLLGWQNPFIESLAYSVMLHLGTLAALLLYFAADWRRLGAAVLASLRERRIGDDRWRRLAWVLVVALVPAAVAGALLADVATLARRPEIVAVALVLGAAILWYADKIGRRDRGLEGVGFLAALGIGAAQAIALIPGISRSGITIAAGLFLGLEREAAARFSFLLAAPTIAGAGAFEAYRLVRGEAGVLPDAGVLAAGIAASLASGLLAIHVLLEWLRRRGVGVFVAYRIALAAIVLVLLLRA